MTASAAQHPDLRQRGRVFSRRGISLIEIVVVIAIAGIMAAIATPRVSGTMNRQRALAAAKRIASDLAYARSDAILTGTAHRVYFSPLRGMYSVVEAPNPVTLAAAPYRVNITAAPYQCKLRGAGFGVDTAVMHNFTGASEGAALVVFDGYGTPDTGGQVAVGCGTTVYMIELDTMGGVTTRLLSAVEVAAGFAALGGS